LVSSPSTPGAYLFGDVKERDNYEENLEEERKHKQNNGYAEKSVDLMKKLDDFLKK
jgi:hypothetical protein